MEGALLQRYIARRVLWLLVILIGVTVPAFGLIRLVPGDVVTILMQADAGGSFVEQEKMRAFFGLDQPVLSQYWHWLKGLLQGDLGTSFRTGRPVLTDMVAALPITGELLFGSIFVALAVGIPLGILAAARRSTWVDTVARVAGIVGLSVPNFWLGTLLLLIVTLYWPHTMVLGYVPFMKDPMMNLRGVVLPIVALGLVSAAAIMRMTRSSMLDVLSQAYVQTARAKGLHPRKVIHRHAFRNALIPVITLLGVEMGSLIGGTVVLERVFALPGLGQLIVYAIEKRDYPTVQAVTLFIAAAFAVMNLVIDVAYALLDPRIQYD